MRGSKVIGNWGAMHALSYGEITVVEDSGVDILWDNGAVHRVELSDIRDDYENTNEIGIYFDFN